VNKPDPRERKKKSKKLQLHPAARREANTAPKEPGKGEMGTESANKGPGGGNER